MSYTAGRLATLVRQTLGSPLPVRLRAWDGSEAGPDGPPTLVVRDRRALHRLLWKPGELGLARAWVAGEIDVEGDLYEALDRLGTLVRAGGDGDGPAPPAGRVPATLRDPRIRQLAREALALAGPALPPAPPREEAGRRRGARHSPRRDRAAISHHYDVGNDFYALVLGPSMVYSCAYWAGPDGAGPSGGGAAAADGTVRGTTLEDAQRAKLDLICRKLALRPGARLLDVGCGWGAMVAHAAEHYGVRAVGVTLSAEQAAFARERIAAAGLGDRVEIRVRDYREVTDGPYDAISSIGMAEHVGAARYREYAAALYGLLRPGGRLLNHQIARRPWAEEARYRVDRFIDRYVFPDGELAPLGSTVALLEEAGFEVRDVQALREHYALTLRAWVANLEANWAAAVRLTSPGRARVWRLYMAASALAFERNRLGVNQVLAVRATAEGVSGMPLVRGPWAERVEVERPADEPAAERPAGRPAARPGTTPG
ncbi:class I SAM-dependent methyltransferase [Allostreptomyces psammosilenae]|uniref:Cyclopropane-fatty-acyl-phospholipid synthase n=1 Tax=Allostreptomyces psammosilenae TaxID=1892865 RepID=A0A853A1A1_9ACTN|nr:class I SAM-dependent methyltransferase [Allostreptomyces psammosilenae]NYI04292.1 cyclopropane-fatty-acyl-phospholipid synthase [Allostreptomyces psammosilenae]